MDSGNGQMRAIALSGAVRLVNARGDSEYRVEDHLGARREEHRSQIASLVFLESLEKADSGRRMCSIATSGARTWKECEYGMMTARL